jgi:hypothetical protein
MSKTFTGSDIKRCWELSRWGWAPLLARAWRFSGDGRYRDGLNAWSQSWCQANPVNAGTNWLCGQEASMRLLNALQAWQLCNAPSQLPEPTPHRAAFVAAHLQRIAATERYAQAQDNNHWTSEAAALFVGGSWLAFSDGIKPVHTFVIGGDKYTIYTGLAALAFNIIVAVVVQLLMGKRGEEAAALRQAG